MSDYIGAKCIVCEKEFTNDDEIVVCPDCGTPYHKACYLKEGKCINNILHEKNQSWKSVNDFSEQENENIKCSNCGETNPSTGLFCKKCGVPLSKAQQTNPFSNTNLPPFGRIISGASDGYRL